MKEERYAGERFMIQLTDPMVYDRLLALSAEYTISQETLVNVAVKRLIEDVDFVRSLRTGKMRVE